MLMPPAKLSSSFQDNNDKPTTTRSLPTTKNLVITTRTKKMMNRQRRIIAIVMLIITLLPSLWNIYWSISIEDNNNNNSNNSNDKSNERYANLPPPPLPMIDTKKQQQQQKQPINDRDLHSTVGAAATIIKKEQNNGVNNSALEKKTSRIHKKETFMSLQSSSIQKDNTNSAASFNATLFPLESSSSLLQSNNNNSKTKQLKLSRSPSKPPDPPSLTLETSQNVTSAMMTTIDHSTKKTTTRTTTTSTSSTPQSFSTTLAKMQIPKSQLSSSSSTHLPPWLIDFMNWQTQQLTTLTQYNWKRFRFLILRCSKRDLGCGGTSDRLKPLPFQLRVAYESQRLYMIRWEVPYPLQEFLEPNVENNNENNNNNDNNNNNIDNENRNDKSGSSSSFSFLNWTVPEYMERFLREPNHVLFSYSVANNREYTDSNNNTLLYAFDRKATTFPTTAKTSQAAIVEIKQQLDDGGEAAYKDLILAAAAADAAESDASNNVTDTTTQGGNDNNNNNNNKTKPIGTSHPDDLKFLSYRSVYHGIFRALFRPSPGVAAEVERQLDAVGLVPGEYSVAHVRNFYKRPMTDVPIATRRSNGIMAVKCASRLHPGDPIYFASDSYDSTLAVQQFAVANNYKIYTNLQVSALATNNNNHSTSKEITATANITSGNTTTITTTMKQVDPLHLDFAGKGNRTWPVSAYYDTFVDLLILGNARCVSFGEGGYGLYANLLSFDPECTFQNVKRHRGKPQPLVCDWKDDKDKGPI